MFKPVKAAIEKLFLIPNKEGNIVPFKLNVVQNDFHDRRVHRMDVLKARQEGMTSFIMAWFLMECMTHYTRAVMVAHDKEATTKLLHRCRFYLETMRGAKPQISRANDQEIYFQKTRSSFTIGTAGTKTFGRGDTITHLHCSETAFWKDPQTIMTGLFQAVPHKTGIIIKESTANGYGTHHHRQYMRATKGESRFVPLFYPWHIFPEYNSQTPMSHALTTEEKELMKTHNLTLEHIQWRREKLEDLEGNETLFKQEYPLTPDEAFRTTGGSLFPMVESTPSSGWTTIANPYGVGSVSYLKNHPNPDYSYVAGSDVSGGTGNDYSTLQIICVNTMEQVLAYRTNQAAPPEFSKTVEGFWEEYDAYLVPEQNQHGLSLIACARASKHGQSNMHRLYRTKHPVKQAHTSQQLVNQYGFKTTAATKYSLVGNLVRFVKELTLYDIATVDQLRGFGELEDGKLGNMDSSGHDDDVIALALCIEGYFKERLRAVDTPVLKPNQAALNDERMTSVSFEDIKSRINQGGNSSRGYWSRKQKERMSHV